MNGWVKTYRKIQEHWIWTSKEPYDMRSAWQYLIMNANYAENKILTQNGELLEIGRGQILVSVRNLSEKWKWSVSKVSKFLKRLEDDNMVQRIGNKSGTLLTIVNYSVYQGYENTKDTPNDTQEEHGRYTEQYTEDTPNDTPKIQGAVQNKESKEDKNDKENKDIHNVQKDTKKADANALFEKLWELYPVKKGKGQVSDTAKLRLLKIGEEELLRAIERYKAELEKDSDWRKPQNGSTFFNSGYVDYLDENYVPSERQKKKSYSGISERLAEETERNIRSGNEYVDSDFY